LILLIPPVVVSELLLQGALRSARWGRMARAVEIARGCEAPVGWSL